MCGSVALGQREVVAHADLVAVADDGRAGQREHERVGHLKAAAVALQHGREAAADAAVVELHVFVRGEGGEAGLALRGREAAEVELVMIAEKLAPLRGGGAARGGSGGSR